MTGNPALLDAISREIAAAGGRLSFERFMDLALYHPRLGYYTSQRAQIGKTGDYFTSVSVGPLFGRLLAKQFLQCRRQLGDPPEFEIVEFGGHHGQLRADVLAAAGAENLRYRVVEAGDPLPETIVGCVFSNEFLDALPVHRVRAVAGQWQEIYVTAAESLPTDPKGEPIRLPSTGGVGGGFREITGPLSTPRLAEALADLPVALMAGYTTEINLRALDWLAAVAQRLRRGFVLTVDYGFERADYFAPHRHAGHLQCYRHHTRTADPYQHVGDQDLTAHVEFTSLIKTGRRLGLDPVLFTDQSHYLLKLGETEITEIVERTAGHPNHERQAVQQLIHPGLMGRAFQVLLQRRRES